MRGRLPQQYRSYSYALWSTSSWAPGNTSNRISTSWMNAQLVREVGTQSVILMRDFVQIHIHMQTCTIGLTLSPVFPPKGGNMVLPHPLVLLPHPLIFKFILKNNTDWTLFTKHHVPWMQSATLNIYHEGNTAFIIIVLHHVLKMVRALHCKLILYWQEKTTKLL